MSKITTGCIHMSKITTGYGECSIRVHQPFVLVFHNYLSKHFLLHSVLYLLIKNYAGMIGWCL